MQNRNHAYLLLIGGIGAALMLSGCPKKVETVKGAATVQEEKVTPPAEAVQPEAMPAPRVEETPVGREAEAPAVEAGLGDAYFDYDEYTIRADARAALESNARWLNGNPNVRVRIEGHADERGTNEYNLALGERRAQSAKRFLAALGLDQSRLSAISYGEERSVCTETTEGCYAKNRRVHFTIQ
ncbi:MAG TPA: peptidoglycan-associated lipoprotein Pal [Nitrospiria bacterium]